MSNFDEFMKRREEAARAYVSGDAEPLARLSARALPASFFSPRGDHVQGAQDVSARYGQDAGLFESGSETHFEILHMAADGDVGYWVGFQRANVRMRGHAEPQRFDLRVTEIFRREDGQWKLVHRHADPVR